jgi:hypothetical protein
MKASGRRFMALNPKAKRGVILKKWRDVDGMLQGVVCINRLRETISTKISLFGRQLLAE